MVEHNLAKVGAAGSIPVSRSIFNHKSSFILNSPGGEMVDTRDLKSLGSDTVPVRPRLAAPFPLHFSGNAGDSYFSAA